MIELNLNFEPYLALITINLQQSKMDIDMNMDDLIKRDKKLGRVRQNGNPATRGGPLPGRGRGGRGNAQNARAQPRLRVNNNGINKLPNQQQRQR